MSTSSPEPTTPAAEEISDTRSAAEEPVRVGTPLNRRRGRSLLIALAGLLVVSVLAVAMALTRGASAAQVAAEAKAPDRSVLTEPVTSRALTAALVTRAEVTSESSTPVTCRPGSSESSTVSVFTRPPASGEVLPEGGVVAAVNGRPVLVVQGSTPAFRALTPGVSGDDVRQLQAALARMGLDVGADGVFDATTQASVASWYRSRGFTPVEPTADEAARLASARSQLTQAQSSQREAQAAYTKAAAGPSKAELLSAELSLAQAQQTLNEAGAAGQDTTIARLQLQQAQAQLADLKKKPDLSSASEAVRAAKDQVSQAQDQLAAVQSSTGVTIPFCELIFSPGAPVTVSTNGLDMAGDPASTSAPKWVVLTGGRAMLRSELSSSQAQGVTIGAKASFETSSGTAEGTVTSLEPDGSGTVVMLIAPDQELTGDLQGQNLRVSITTGSTGAAVLVVPLMALSTDAQGRPRVVVQQTDGRLKDVQVVTGLTAAGYVEVRPAEGATLAEGDSVVTSR